LGFLLRLWSQKEEIKGNAAKGNVVVQEKKCAAKRLTRSKKRFVSAVERGLSDRRGEMS